MNIEAKNYIKWKLYVPSVNSQYRLQHCFEVCETASMLSTVSRKLNMSPERLFINSHWKVQASPDTTPFRLLKFNENSSVRRHTPGCLNLHLHGCENFRPGINLRCEQEGSSLRNRLHLLSVKCITTNSEAARNYRFILIKLITFLLT
jgi:hypothetical protein